MTADVHIIHQAALSFNKMWSRKIDFRSWAAWLFTSVPTQSMKLCGFKSITWHFCQIWIFSPVNKETMDVPGFITDAFKKHRALEVFSGTVLQLPPWRLFLWLSDWEREKNIGDKKQKFCVWHVCLLHPDVRLTFRSGGKRIMSWGGESFAQMCLE